MKESGYLFTNYKSLENSYDEYFDENQNLRADLQKILQSINNLSFNQFKNLQVLAEKAFKKSSVTFTSNYNDSLQEKIFPFDILPRIIKYKEWKNLEKGLIQRVNALNLFLYDIYHEQKILKDKVIPRELIESSPCYSEKLKGITPKGKVYVHIAGIDIIRDEVGNFLVLEDNVRVPSGVSYALENRYVTKKVMHNVLEKNRIFPIDDYPIQLRNSLTELTDNKDGLIVLLTPGIYNSAYFEHVFLAKKMGCQLAEGRDLFVEGDKVYLKTILGPKLVTVIYTRINDEYLDPDVFNKQSLIGIKGLCKAYAKGNVVLANAMGNGIADEKGVYPYMPSIIKYYLSEEVLLKQVDTYSCIDDSHLDYVLDNFNQLVIKAVNSSGGMGTHIMQFKTEEEQALLIKEVLNNPRNFIAQRLIELSACPTYIGSQLKAQRIDLRPFILTGKSSWVMPGGLTRVALKDNGYIVNSSQGGSSKDTWIMREDNDI